MYKRQEIRASRQSWVTGRATIINPAAKPTLYEVELERLGLQDASSIEELVESQELRKWCNFHKDSHYVPSSVLKAFNLTTCWDIERKGLPKFRAEFVREAQEDQTGAAA